MFSSQGFLRLHSPAYLQFEMSLKKIVMAKKAKTKEVQSKVSDAEHLVKKVNAVEESNKRLAKEKAEIASKFEAYQKEVQGRLIREQLTNAAKAKRAVDPDDIVGRFIDKARFDSETNTVRLEGSDLSLDDAVGEFLKTKPYLMQAEKSQGQSSGASPFPQGPEGKVVDIGTSSGATEYVRSMMPGQVKKASPIG